MNAQAAALPIEICKIPLKNDFYFNKKQEELIHNVKDF